MAYKSSTISVYSVSVLWGIMPSKADAAAHFATVQATLLQLDIIEAKHKLPPPPSKHVMVWWCLQFDTPDTTIPIPSSKLTKIVDLVAERQHHKHTNIHDHRVLFGKPFFVS